MISSVARIQKLKKRRKTKEVIKNSIPVSGSCGTLFRISNMFFFSEIQFIKKSHNKVKGTREAYTTYKSQIFIKNEGSYLKNIKYMDK
jgi:hypothetical protein